MLRDLATQAHRRAQSSERDVEYVAARRLYEQYLARFGEDEQAYAVRYFHAETLRALKLWRAAAMAYDRVAEINAGGRYHQTAALDAVEAWDKALSKDAPPAADVVRFVNACDRFVSVAPADHPQRNTVRFKAAEAQRQQGKLQDALHRYDRLIEDGVKRALQTRVVRSIKVARFQVIREAEVQARGLKSNAARKAALSDVSRQFQVFAETHSGPSLNPRALHNAVVAATEAEQLDRAIGAARTLIRTYPDSELRAGIELKLARLYEQTADLQAAADAYARFARRHPQHEQWADALHNAAVLYHRLENTDAAMKHLARYLRSVPRAPGHRALHQALCENQDSAERWRAAASCWHAVSVEYPDAPADGTFIAVYQRAQALGAAGKKRLARRVYARLSAGYGDLDPTTRARSDVAHAAATAAFALIEPDFGRFKKRRITLKRTSLLRMVKDADALAARYVAILDYRSADRAIASLTRVGVIYSRLASAIREAPLPRGLDVEQRAIYRAELERFALAPQSKGLEAFEKALAKGSELSIESRWTRIAREHVGALRSGEPSGIIVPRPRLAEPFIVISQLTRAR